MSYVFWKVWPQTVKPTILLGKGGGQKNWPKTYLLMRLPQLCEFIELLLILQGGATKNWPKTYFLPRLPQLCEFIQLLLMLQMWRNICSHHVSDFPLNYMKRSCSSFQKSETYQNWATFKLLLSSNIGKHIRCSAKILLPGWVESIAMNIDIFRTWLVKVFYILFLLTSVQQTVFSCHLTAQ